MSNKALIPQDNSSWSIWTCLPASPCYTGTETSTRMRERKQGKQERERETDRQQREQGQGVSKSERETVSKRKCKAKTLTERSMSLNNSAQTVCSKQWERERSTTQHTNHRQNRLQNLTSKPVTVLKLLVWKRDQQYNTTQPPMPWLYSNCWWERERSTIQQNPTSNAWLYTNCWWESETNNTTEPNLQCRDCTQTVGEREKDQQHITQTTNRTAQRT